MSVTMGQILALLNEMAPGELAESYDNVGLLAGHPDRPVERILVALDLTMGAVAEAKEMGAQLIVTHHPILFRGRKNLREDDAEGAAVCAMIRAGIGLIAAHTNFDNAERGVNDALSEALSLSGISHLPQGMRIGMLESAYTPDALGRMIEERLGGRVRIYAERPDAMIERVAVCGGAGGDFFDLALQNGAQAFVTGEVKHHDALAAVAAGLCLIEAGHDETEHIAIKLLADGLQEKINEVQYNVTVSESAYAPFWRF